MTWQTIAASIGGLVCVSSVGGFGAVAISYLRSKANAAQLNTTSPAGPPPAPPPKVNIDADQPAIKMSADAPERKQTVSRSFDAWSVDKQEEMLVVSLMGDGKEQEAIDLLQLRIKRKKVGQSTQAVPTTIQAVLPVVPQT